MKCLALRNVPENKLLLEIKRLEDSNLEDKKLYTIKKAIHRYFDSNIPVKYWMLEMNKSFSGDQNLLDYYNSLNVDDMFKNGSSICFSGRFGSGKTMTATNILKRALEKGYSGLYVTLTDIISIMKTNDSFSARKELIKSDFLIIDEFDPRYMGSEASSDFHGRVLEDILRNRSNNKLPIVLCSNSADPVSSFSGSIKEGINSLWNYVNLIPVLGKDYRKIEGTNE